MTGTEEDVERKDHVEGQQKRCYQLQAVLKDQKAGRVLSASYCDVETVPSCNNLLAVVSERMLTIYDDFHMGEYVAVVAQYVHPEEDLSRIQACTWIPGSRHSELHSKSPRLALLLSDGRVAVVSIIDSKVTHVIETGLSQCGANPCLLAPPSWDHCSGGERLIVFDSSAGNVYVVDGTPGHKGVLGVCDSARAVAMSKRGDAVLVAKDEGILRLDMDGREYQDGMQKLPTSSSSSSSSMIRGIVPVDERRCILKLHSSFELWDMETCSRLSSWSIAHKGDQSTRPFSANKELAVIGTDEGDAHIFYIEQGKEMSVVSVVRVNSEVEAVALSDDGTHIVLAAGNGFLFRYSYR